MKNKWSNKRIQKFFQTNRNSVNDVYLGEKILLENFLRNGSTVLDIGCGYGGFYNILKKMKKRINYTGIDFNEDMIINAKKKYPKSNFKYYAGSNYKNFLKKKYDYVIIFGVLHLNLNWRKILINAKEISKKGLLFDLRTHKGPSIENINKSYFKLGDSEKFDIIPYNIINKSKLDNFFQKVFKNYSLFKISYDGKPSQFSSTPISKVSFENFFLKKNKS